MLIQIQEYTFQRSGFPSPTIHVYQYHTITTKHTNSECEKLCPELFQITTTTKKSVKAELIFKENKSHSVLKQTKLRKDKQKRGENNRNRRKKRLYIMIEITLFQTIFFKI